MNTIGERSNAIVSRPIFNKEFVEKVKKTEIAKKDVVIEDQEFNIEEAKQFEEVLEIANDVFFGDEIQYEFQVHEKTGTFMSKLVNTETGETIREIPSEKILDMIAELWEIAGVIIDDHA